MTVGVPITDSQPIRAKTYPGIWDCQSSQAVIEFVRRGITAKQELHRICENLMDNCLSNNSETGGVGCDNMTMAIIGLLRGKSKEEWYDLIAKRVADGDGPCAPPEYGESSSFRRLNHRILIAFRHSRIACATQAGARRLLGRQLRQ